MIVAAAALAFRLLFIFWGWTGWRTVTHDHHYMTLSWVYATEGYGICAGYGYVEPTEKVKDLDALAATRRITPSTAPRIDPSTLVPEMLHPPGMALLNAAVHFLTGMPVDFPIQFVGAFLDTITACLVCWVAATIFQPKIGFVAGLLYAFYPPQAANATILRSSEGFLSFFVVGCLVCVLQMSRSTGKARIAWCVGASLLLGVGSYIRPDYLLAPVVMGFALWIFTRQFWRSLVAMIAVQIVALLILLPWAYRNHQLCDRWIFTSTGLGWTLVGGLGNYNNPWGIKGLDKHRQEEARAQGFSSPATPEADLYFRKVFWDAVTSKPIGYVEALAKRLPLVIVAPQGFGYRNPWKTSRFSDAMEQGQDRFDVVRTRPLYVLTAYWDWILMGGIGIASLLCTAYMVFQERHRFGLMLLLLSPHLDSIVTHWLIHYEPRYVLPSTFSLLVGLAYVLCKVWKGTTPKQGLTNAVV